MKQLLLLGAEAIAQGALDAGISGVYAYPGTPSTEITTYIQNTPDAQKGQVKSSWSANEKTAYEAAMGMSYAGKRALICMKHVGLNVAADAFMNSAITGVNGGMVLAVADDPSMHSSQNEQDSRVYGRFAMLPVCEPASQQELYDTMFYAFELSEKVQLPVIIRLTTRLSHSRSGVMRVSNSRTQNSLQPETRKSKYVLLPVNARKNYQHLIELQPKLENYSEFSELNFLQNDTNHSLGIMAFGIAYNYVMEIKKLYHLHFPVLKIGQYPLPRKMINAFINENDKILLAEEGYPVYEELLRGFHNHPKIKGRLDQSLPRTGELSPDIIAKALKLSTTEENTIPEIVSTRPPALCKGCGHRDLFEAINTILPPNKRHVFSDIGCYTLGALPPFNSISTCVDMGASITMAKGAADAGMHPAVAVIGDSTFTHSGITGLLDAVNDKSSITVIISDNTTTAMTGGQQSSATGKIESICMGLGVSKKHIHIITPLKNHLEKNIEIIEKEFIYEGVSVIISQRECIQTAMKKRKAKKVKTES